MSRRKNVAVAKTSCFTYRSQKRRVLYIGRTNVAFLSTGRKNVSFLAIGRTNVVASLLVAKMSGRKVAKTSCRHDIGRKKVAAPDLDKQ